MVVGVSEGMMKFGYLGGHSSLTPNCPMNSILFSYLGYGMTQTCLQLCKLRHRFTEARMRHLEFQEALTNPVILQIRTAPVTAGESKLPKRNESRLSTSFPHQQQQQKQQHSVART